jgi:hypothetical protein
MAIFRSVGCFYFQIPEEICFAGSTCTWLRKNIVLNDEVCDLRYYFQMNSLVVWGCKWGGCHEKHTNLDEL